MSYRSRLEQQIQQILAGIDRPAAVCGDMDTRTILHELALKYEWDQADIQKINFLSTRIDISKKIFPGYSIKGYKGRE